MDDIREQILWFEDAARLQAKAADDMREIGAVGQKQRGVLIRMYQAKVIEFTAKAQELQRKVPA